MPPAAAARLVLGALPRSPAAGGRAGIPSWAGRAVGSWHGDRTACRGRLCCLVSWHNAEVKRREPDLPPPILAVRKTPLVKHQVCHPLSECAVRQKEDARLTSARLTDPLRSVPCSGDVFKWHWPGEKMRCKMGLHNPGLKQMEREAVHMLPLGICNVFTRI